MAVSVAAPEGRPVYTRVEAGGLVIAAAGPAFIVLMALLSGVSFGEDLIFFAIGITVPLVAAGLVWRFGTWSKVVGIVAGVLVVLGLFWTVFGLAYPASFGDFVPAILVPTGVVLALGGGVAALVQQRRGNLQVAVTRTERRILAVAAGVIALAIIGSGVANLVNRTAAADVTAAIPVTISDFAFAEGTYTVPADRASNVQVHNSDAFAHTFTVPELGIDETLLPGSGTNVEITAPAGTYTLYCKPHSDMSVGDPAQAGMAATIVAEPAGLLLRRPGPH